MVRSGRADCLVSMFYMNRTNSIFEKGSDESTHKVPTSHYHTKHCHAAVASFMKTETQTRNLDIWSQLLSRE
jgi:hypothetical protein